VPKGKIKGERASTAAMPASKRTMLVAAAVVVLAVLALTFWLLGNPIDLLSDATPPAVSQSAVRWLPPAAVALAVPAALPAPSVVPPPVPNSFSLLIGTYDNARQARLIEEQLRALKLEPYTIDIVMAPEDVQRRILIGRFPTAAEAEAVKQTLGPGFANARPIPGAMERLRVVP